MSNLHKCLQRDKTHEIFRQIQSVELWAKFCHESHCFALIALSQCVHHCTQLILRQSCTSKTVFLMAKSAKENSRPLSDAARHSMLLKDRPQFRAIFVQSCIWNRSFAASGAWWRVHTLKIVLSETWNCSASFCLASFLKLPFVH